jgi:hypothetical protein
VIDIEQRLAELGDLLAIDDADLSVTVVASAGVPAGRSARLTPLRIAAVVVLVIAAAVAIVPSARDTVAGWLGLDRVEIERRDDLVVPATAPPVTAPTGTNPLEEAVVTVEGSAVLVGTIDGRLSDVFIDKTLGMDASAASLVIDGMPAIWIEEPHELMIERDGLPVAERIAGATLLWQEGDVLWRVEGFATLDEAVAYVRSR